MRTMHDQLMSALDPSDPATIGRLLDFHRAHFGDTRMEEGEGDGDGKDDNRDGKDTGREDEPADLGDAGKRALKAERDARAAEKKRADDLEAEIAKRDAEKLTDQQRIEKERDDAKSGESKAVLKASQYEAAAEAGLPLSMARRINGGSPEEMLTDAKALKAELEEHGKTKPAPDPSQGGRGGSNTSSVADAKAEYLESRKQ